MELDDRLTFLLLQRFDRDEDELAGFDPNLVHHTRSRLIDENYVVSKLAVLRGDDEVKAIVPRHELTIKGQQLFMMLQRKQGRA